MDDRMIDRYLTYKDQTSISLLDKAQIQLILNIQVSV